MIYKNPNVNNAFTAEVFNNDKFAEMAKNIDAKFDIMAHCGICKLTSNQFEFIRVTGNADQFDDLKGFGYNKVYISYETAPGIENYWLIQIDDCLKNKKVVVPTGDYIVKIYDEGLTLVDQEDFKMFFSDMTADEITD